MYSIDKAKQAKIDGKIVNRNDFMSGHGKANSRDKLTRQTPGNGQKLDIKACENLYATNSVAMNIVDIIAEDMVRAGWTLKTENKEIKKAIESKWRKLKTKDRFQKLYADQRLYGDGFLSIGVVSNSPSQADLNTPIDLRKIKSIPYVNTFNTQKVTQLYFNQDMFSEHFGEVEFFGVNRVSQLGEEILSGTTASTSEQIHRSRIIHEQGLRFEGETKGRSIFESLYDIITVMDTSLWSVGQILYDFAFKVYKTDGVEGLDKDDKANLTAMLDFMFRTEALAIIKSDEELSKESTNVTGMKDLLDYGWDYLAGAVRMPKTVLKGQEAGTLTGAQYDVMNYYARVSSIQENRLRPQLEYLTRLLMWASDDCGKSIDPDSFEWAIEFNPLWNLDGKTDAEVRKLTAEADQIYIVNGVLSPDEVQETRFGRFGLENSSKFSGDSAQLDKLAKLVYDAYAEKNADG
ncbi:hypothetical protein A0I81_10250 [Listeria monocytogenes]|uniref:DUF1073 domain-containing protein n=1 Tax=Listeria monocytogenes TaxID=1639 RepID=UPI000BDF0F95|nr:anti-CBASS Acb1 family protein [Listeria monocytogenes]EAE2750768.1 DUF1073 domain-containing protein [Listeria monocytogenes]EAE4263380.1 DUF1073 domain-containing protein [Listeria monocytogenes]EAE4811150.1 DUF1073 domain-containing protein [Listeria monocytogenes]EAE5205005.1 DUF1073 domain-containing protein [Listeria monocytogenes]EAE5559680.1 DUF1073 domain-containing protein [Listeria monocytogenes]